MGLPQFDAPTAPWILWKEGKGGLWLGSWATLCFLAVIFNFQVLDGCSLTVQAWIPLLFPDSHPRPSGASDVAFFMHGILDTSLGWVANGVTGSTAFAAFDQGFDVWLGSCRSNPPRTHTGRDPPTSNIRAMALSNLHPPSPRAWDLWRLRAPLG